MSPNLVCKTAEAVQEYTVNAVSGFRRTIFRKVTLVVAVFTSGLVEPNLTKLSLLSKLEM